MYIRKVKRGSFHDTIVSNSAFQLGIEDVIGRKSPSDDAEGVEV